MRKSKQIHEMCRFDPRASQVRTLAFGTGGWRFESSRVYFFTRAESCGVTVVFGFFPASSGSLDNPLILSVGAIKQTRVINSLARYRTSTTEMLTESLAGMSTRMLRMRKRLLSLRNCDSRQPPATA